MPYTVEVKSPTELTVAERRSCHAMSYHGGGDLSPWLNEAVQVPSRKAKVVLVREADTIVGWAFRWDKTGATGYWTRTTHRGRGIGTLMVKETLNLGKISTHPHDYPSAKLFVKTSALPRGEVRIWKNHIKEVEKGLKAKSS